MKVLFIEARKKVNSNLEKIKEKLHRELPKEIHILYTIQYKDLAEKIKKLLEKKHRILGFEQVLGCSEIKPKASLLLIGSGKFHALQIALSTGKELYVYENNIIKKLSKEEINNFKLKEKGKISKFLASENIGMLVSNKPGQNKLQLARKFKKKLENKFKDKKFYIFLTNSLETKELENFPLDLYINFACPGLELDNEKILNYKKIKSILHQ